MAHSSFLTRRGPLISMLGYFGMMAGLLSLIAWRGLFSKSSWVIGVQMAAAALFFWARITFGRRSFHVAANPTEGGLVTTGPYRYIRHPIYTALCLFTGAGALSHFSWKTALAFLVIAGCALLRIFSEEFLVSQRYPEYAQYAAGNWRMIPFLF